MSNQSLIFEFNDGVKVAPNESGRYSTGFYMPDNSTISEPEAVRQYLIAEFSRLGVFGIYPSIEKYIDRLCELAERPETNQTECELCNRKLGTETEEIKPITVGGNTFQACDICFAYLSTPYTIDCEQPEALSVPEFPT